MDLGDITHWGWLLLFCFGVYVVTASVRKVTEGLAPSLKTNRIWNDVVLFVLPIALGAVLVLPYPLPAAITTLSMRLTLGICGGFVSTSAYKVFKALVKKQTGVEIGPESVAVVVVAATPPPLPEAKAPDEPTS